MTRILITNDDGIDAPGIRWLARAAVEQGLDVVVAAPVTEASGSSAALTAVERDGRIVAERRDLPQLDGVPAYAVATSPAYIVVLALRGAFGPAPDVILSGINRGANAGAAVLHSGTVGAALTAAGSGLRAVAVSLDVLTPVAGSAATGGAAISAIDRVDDESRHWAGAARLAVRLLPTLDGCPGGTVLNINVPDRPVEQIRGVVRAGLARFGQVQVTVAEAGEDFLRTAVQESPEPLEPGTDLAALADGHAVVTPLRAIGEADHVTLDLSADLLKELVDSGTTG